VAQHEWEHDLMSAPPALANVLRPHGEFAIIGPGGGRRRLARRGQWQSERDWDRNQSHHRQHHHARAYADYAQHLYDRPDVHIHVTDGRSFYVQPHNASMSCR